MTLFGAYLMVDWSGAARPTKGKDSIWIAEAEADDDAIKVVNIPTRGEATRWIADRIECQLSGGIRVLAGFDFAFGYPAGSAGLFGAQSWEGVWEAISAAIIDGADNVSNRFEAAGAFNRAGAAPEGPFWGLPWQHKDRYDGLSDTKPEYDVPYPEWRHAERFARGAHSVWKLCYNGAVGSQTLLGIPRLRALRRTLPAMTAVWPFETDFAAALPPPPSVVMAEIFPSLFPLFPRPGEIRDEAQVRTVVQLCRHLDKRGALQRFLSAPEALDPSARAEVLSEEGWIMGLGHGDMTL